VASEDELLDEQASSRSAQPRYLRPVKHWILVALLAVACCSACDTTGPGPRGSDAGEAGGSPPRAVSPTASGSPTHPLATPTSPASPAAGSTDCSNESSMASNPHVWRPGSLTGDVDGDGVRDTVRIAIDPHGSHKCRAFVVAKLADRTVAGAIAQWEPAPTLPAPHLNSLAEIDAVTGADIVIDVNAGASTQFEGVYTYSGGELTQLQVIEFPFTGLFAYGGSVGHLDGQACTSDRSVVVSSAVPKASSAIRYAVVRRFFIPAAGQLVYEPARTQHLVVKPASLSKFPEFSGPPFSQCGST
jgi:hypothetical protein